MDGEASPGAIEASSFTELHEAPQGWHKKVVPRKGGTPKRSDVVFVAPNGETIRSKRQLERYLKAHPGGPLLLDFNWSTGETPRRSERLSTKTRKSIDSPNAAPLAKRAKKGTPAKISGEDEDGENDVLKDVVAVNDSKEDAEMLDTNPSEKETPLMQNKDTDTEISEVAECKIAESNRSEVPEGLVKESKLDEETENKILEEAVPVELKSKQGEETVNNAFESDNDQIAENEKFEQPSSIKDIKENDNEDGTVEKIFMGGLVKDSMIDKNIVTNDIREEFIPDTTEDVDLEMQHPGHVTDNCFEQVIFIKEDIKLSVESTKEIAVVENVIRLEQTSEAELSMEGKEVAIENFESNEKTNDVTNESFSALDIPGHDKPTETIQTADPDITSYMNVIKGQEAHHAEVGVSS